MTESGLNEDHKKSYRHIGRWVLAAVLLGLGIGYATEVSTAAIAVLTAFLSGA